MEFLRRRRIDKHKKPVQHCILLRNNRYFAIKPGTALTLHAYIKPIVDMLRALIWPAIALFRASMPFGMDNPNETFYPKGRVLSISN